MSKEKTITGWVLAVKSKENQSITYQFWTEEKKLNEMKDFYNDGGKYEAVESNLLTFNISI